MPCGIIKVGLTNQKYKINEVNSGDALIWSKENNIHYIAVEGSNRWGSDWNKQKKALIKIFK